MKYAIAVFLLAFSYALVANFLRHHRFSLKNKVFLYVYLFLVGCSASFMSYDSVHYWLIALCYPFVGFLAMHFGVKNYTKRQNGAKH